MQTIPAKSLRGRTIRFRGLVRAASREATGAAALWLRVDRPDQQMGFFDNMGDRPIRDPEWKEYAIEGPVAEDATSVAFGVMASGDVTADFETNRSRRAGEDGSWTPMAVEDGGFEAGSDVQEGGGEPALRRTSRSRGRPSAHPKAASFCACHPGRAPRVTTTAAVDERALREPTEERRPRRYRSWSGPESASGAGVVRGGGRRGRKGSSPLATLRAALAGSADSSDQPDLDTRLADVVVAWNVFRHFYPVLGRVRRRLGCTPAAAARACIRRDDARRTSRRLRLLVADVRDGHGSVVDPRGSGNRGALPVQFGVIEVSSW